jgi:hypothetical protein
MAYTHTTWATLKDQLAARLHDPTKTFWLDQELSMYLSEALHVFGALSSFWRDRGTFATVNGTAFYTLQTTLSLLCAYTITNRDIVNELQYHLLEPANDWTTTTWAGTSQFTMDDFVQAVQRRRNQFLADTGCTLTYQVISQSPPPIGRVNIPSNTIAVRRVTWIDLLGNYHHLWMDDELALTSYSNDWNLAPQTPYAYSILGTPPVQLQLAPPPIDAGSLGIVTVATGADLAITSSTALGIPDNWAWVVKWGALSDLLSKDGPAYDPARAAWCEKRYQLGVQLASEIPCIVGCQLNGVNVIPDSLHNLDAMYADWESTTGSPTDVAIAGHNLLAIHLRPNGVYSVTLDVVCNAPVPLNDISYVQIGREQLDSIIDYAEHLAMFKVAGPEFTATETQATNFLRQAAAFDSRLSASTRSLFATLNQSKRESQDRPYKEVNNVQS